MRLELQNISFKNFLSFGNSVQKLTFVEGINLILGSNKDSGRSNGSGKSSLIETIPFAWFGKLSRPVNKSSIVNWANGKNCEVINTFKRGDDTYTILRAIKPDKLEIYQNGSMIPIPSNVKMYQETLENDILGMDYSTFIYLFYTNLNVNVPLLKMTVPQKRAFLERMFLLDTYTDLNGVANERIRSTEEKVFKLSVTVEQNDKTCFDLEHQNSSLRLKLVDTSPYEKELEEYKKEYERLNSEPIEKDFESVLLNITGIENDITLTEAEINGIESEIELLKADNDYRDDHISEIEKQKTDHEAKLKEVKEKWNKATDDTSKDSPEKLEAEIIQFDSILPAYASHINSLKVDLATLTEKKRSKEETYETLKEGMCPTCERKLTVNTLDKKYLKAIDLFKIEIDQLEIKLASKNKLSDEGIKKYREVRDELKAVRERQKKKDELTVELLTLKDVKIPSTQDDLDKKIRNKESIDGFTISRESLILKLDSLKENLETVKEEANKIELHLNELSELKNKIDKLENELKLRKSNKNEISSIIQSNTEKIKSLKSETKTASNTINKLKELVDYLSYLKILCKDENVKQYAISSYMSYLIQQTNFYLSSAGSNHYMKFTKWLDEEIHGPGVFGATYGNLSGGEARSIDLAIQFAFLDVAKLKTGIFPDVLLLDEILDSSIDSGGLTNILRIIKTKQAEDKSKMYLITHRTEISDIDVDNIYDVTKINGFSTLEKQ